MEILALIFLLPWGLFMLFFPEQVWELQHIFSVRGGEPTDFYLITTRVNGAILIIVSVVLGFLTFFG